MFAAPDGVFQVIVENHSEFTQTLNTGIIFGTATEFEEVLSTGLEEHQASLTSSGIGCKATVNKVVTNLSRVELRKQMLSSLLTVGDERLREMLLKYHHVFSVEDEHGEITLVQLCIDTGDAPPKK